MTGKLRFNEAQERNRMSSKGIISKSEAELKQNIVSTLRGYPLSKDQLMRIIEILNE
jgi:hypothetical protein